VLRTLEVIEWGGHEIFQTVAVRFLSRFMKTLLAMKEKHLKTVPRLTDGIDDRKIEIAVAALTSAPIRVFACTRSEQFTIVRLIYSVMRLCQPL
jgi:hypothetical protein